MSSEERVALIIGAATGIGRSAALLFADNGIKVAIADNNDKDGESTVREITNLGKEAIFIHADVSSVNDLEQSVTTTVNTYGKLDIFWYNAGIFLQGHIDLVTEKDFDTQITINLKGALFGTKYAIREMRKNNGNNKGCILYTSSMVGLRPNPYEPTYALPYVIAKTGLIALMRSLVEPLAKDNIRINCLCPGPVKTPQWIAGLSRVAELENITEEAAEKRKLARIPLGKAVTMNDISNAALFLTSDKSRMINGIAFPIDGGYTAL
ncbi:SDR family NAD(P)-dependent oxidoreductase [Chloroflexota bacterium]